jgi:NhaA family Na+:H+ antiporter
MAQSPAPSSSLDIPASIVLLLAAVAALVFANTPLAGPYKAVLDMPLDLSVGGLELAKSVKSWIKDALMAIFFLLVGLEIKAEFQEGALSDRRRALLPFAGAAGGMLVPALIYIAITFGDPSLMKGWAIPSATDIAFAVGVVGLLGPKLVPPALKAFLLAVAVIDDLGAILIIAFFYTAGVSAMWLAAVAALCAVLFAFNRVGLKSPWPYLLIGIVMWLALDRSGVSATLTGVIVAMFIPLKAADGSSPLHNMAHALKIPVLFVIMPVFAFANAGVPLKGLGVEDLTSPVTLGIALGLLIGKPIGITLASWIAVASGAARLPEGATWTQMVGVGCIAGIGFTMSLFVGILAFGDGPALNAVRLGVLTGSTAAALFGIAILIAARRSAATAAETEARRAA